MKTSPREVKKVQNFVYTVLPVVYKGEKKEYMLVQIHTYTKYIYKISESSHEDLTIIVASGEKDWLGMEGERSHCL